MDQPNQEELEQSLCARISRCIAGSPNAAHSPMAQRARPRIGLFAPGGVLREGAWQVYGMDQPLSNALFEAGGFPIGLAGIPFIRGLDTFEVLAEPDAFRLVFDTLWPLMLNLDGLLLPGGGDLDSRLYARTPHPQLQGPDAWLDLQQVMATLIAWITFLPTLGVCRGLQVMNVARGGGLFQDHQELRQLWAKHMPPLLAHWRGRPIFRTLINYHHPLIIRQRSWLAQAVCGHGERRPPRYHIGAVLSQHHNFIGVCLPGSEEIVGDLAPGLQVVGIAPDGVIEAIADTDPQRVFVAVQFHPEYVSELQWSVGIFSYHVEACARYAAFPRSELESYREEIATWLWHTIRQRFTGGKRGPTHQAVNANDHSAEVKTDALALQEMTNHVAVHA